RRHPLPPAASTARQRTRAFQKRHFKPGSQNRPKLHSDRLLACPAITRLSSPGGTPRTACRVVTWQAHEQQGESGRIEACQPEVMCQSQMRGVLRGPGACCRAWTGSLPRPCHEPKPKGCSSQAAETTRTSAQLGATFAEPPVEANSQLRLNGYPREPKWLRSGALNAALAGLVADPR